MGAQSVNIPINLALANAKSQIQALQNLLDKVKPDSKAFKDLSAIIGKINKQYANLEIEGKRAFTSNSQFEHFKKGLSDLEIHTEIFQKALEKVSVFELNVDTSELDKINKQIDDLNIKKSNVLSTKIGELFKQEDFKSIADKLNLVLGKSTSFEGLEKSLSGAIDKAKKELEKLQSAQEKAEDSLKKGSVENIDLRSEVLSRYNDSIKLSPKEQKDQINVLKSQNDILKALDLKSSSKSININDFINNLRAQVQNALSNYKATLDAENSEIQQKTKKLKDALNLIGDSTAWSGKKGQEKKQKIGELLGEDFLKKYGSLPKVKAAIEKSLEELEIDKSGLITEASDTADIWFEALEKEIKPNTEQKNRIAKNLTDFFNKQGISFDESELIPLEGQSKEDFVSNLINHLSNKKTQLQKAYDDIKMQIEAKEKEIASYEGTKETIQQASSGAVKELEDLKLQEESLRSQQSAVISSLDALKSGYLNATPILANFGLCIDDLKNKTIQGEKAFNLLTTASGKLNEMKNFFTMWFSFNSVINTTKTVVRNAARELKALDDVMTEIAMVTDMSQSDLWDQIGRYSDVARQYGVSTRGVYEVSQLFYQQGLQGAEVMSLTEETLKLAKIAHLDYATATDYMTVALRGFHMEMSEANHVTDVYSALAAATASDVEELAVAMSKTASSAEAVGSSFESTAAMIATMVSVTREAPQNIGSAIKSIVSRYGEMTSDPSAMVDSEGEEMSLNRVDKALQSVGITLHDATGQFRDFDDVILELSKKWDTLDTLSQRYIATVMAGNRLLLAVTRAA